MVPGLLIGAPWVEEGKLYNAMLLLDGGSIAGTPAKWICPIMACSTKSASSAPDRSPSP